MLSSCCGSPLSRPTKIQVKVIGVVAGWRFTYMEIWWEGCPKKWLWERGGTWWGVHLHGNTKGEISEKVALKKEWYSVRGSFTWKYDGKGVRKKWPWERGSTWWGPHLRWNMKGKVSEKMSLPEGWYLVRGSFTWKYGGKGVWKKGFERGMVLSEGFIYMEIWRERCLKKWPRERGVTRWGVHLHGNMEGKVSEKMALREGWYLVRGSFTWKYEGRDVWKNGPERGVLLGEGFIYMEI